MGNKTKLVLQTVFIPVLVCSFSVWIKMKLETSVTPGMFPILFLAVTFCSWRGGLWPGLVATVFCSTANAYYFIPPYSQFARADFQGVISGALFFLAAIMIATLTSSLHEARKRAMEFVSQKTAFVASVSHELRNPLNVILGMSELLMEEDPHSAKGQDYLNGIKDSGRVLLSLINDILDFSKLSEGKVRLEMRDFDLIAEATEASKLIAEQMKEKKLSFALKISPNVPPYLRGDPARLTQVLWNLLGNAAKYTDRGSIHLNITKAGLNENKTILKFEIVDTGMGVPKKDQSRIFEAFFQTGSSNYAKHRGTGLGLSICKMLVNNMGGEIGFTSEQGRGSIFWFTASFNQANESDCTHKQITHPRLKNANAMRILVAEDYLMNQRVALGMLTKLGYDADIAENGYEVLEALKRENYKAVLMDCNMPLLNGFDTTQKIRKDPAHKHLPIIAMTAYASPEDIKKCISYGMNDHVAKPVHLAELEMVLRRWTAIGSVNLKHLNMDYLNSLKEMNRNSSEDLVADLIDTFLEVMPSRLNEIEKAFFKGDLKTVSHLAHLSRSGAGSLGCERLMAVCKLLENTANKDDRKQVGEVVSQMKEHFLLVKADLLSIRKAA